MPSKPIELPPEVAKAFVRDMRAYFVEESPLKRDEIASRQIHVLRQFQGKNERPIKLHQVKQMFEEMKDHIGWAANPLARGLRLLKHPPPTRNRAEGEEVK